MVTILILFLGVTVAATLLTVAVQPAYEMGK